MSHYTDLLIGGGMTAAVQRIREVDSAGPVEGAAERRLPGQHPARDGESPNSVSSDPRTCAAGCRDRSAPMHAADIMTCPLLSIQRDTSWREALQLLLGSNRNAAPVVDEERHLVGILTEADLTARITESERLELRVVLEGAPNVQPPHMLPRWHAAPHWERTSTVGMIMTASVVTAYAETPVTEVARRLLDHGITQVPIVDREEVLLGMVTQRDIVAVVAAGGVTLVPPMEETFAAWVMNIDN
jgi:CBS domain-containing protein